MEISNPPDESYAGDQRKEIFLGSELFVANHDLLRLLPTNNKWKIAEIIRKK